MGNIVLLDDLTINKIAAGEVIERPASAIKEMVENSIDAGATNITVEIKNGGISYIRITDNGKGIAEDDLEIAFERHATSKIRSAEDLSTVKSMGFRGEALASIAAISRVELVSKTATQANGQKIVVEGGNIIEKSETGTGVGTTITVTNLFYNTPVRYKFLRKDFTEAGYIEDAISRIALAHPEIALKLINTGRTVIQTNGNGDIKTVIYSLYGKTVANSIIDVDYELEDIHIYGVIGKPEIARSNRANQIFFVNKRYVKDKVLSSATERAYKDYIPSGKFAFAVLNIDMNPRKVDVNVHPAKLEVRFENENTIFKAVYNSIKEKLLSDENNNAEEKNEFQPRKETIVEQIYNQRKLQEMGLFEEQPKENVSTQIVKDEVPKEEVKVEEPQIKQNEIVENSKFVGNEVYDKNQEVLRKLQELKQKVLNETYGKNNTITNLETEKDVEEVEKTDEDSLKEVKEKEEIKYNIPVQKISEQQVSENLNGEKYTYEPINEARQQAEQIQYKIPPKEEQPIQSVQYENITEEPIKKENVQEKKTRFSPEFEEMYMKMFGTKPLEEQNKIEKEENNIDDITTQVENISIFDKFPENQKVNYKFIGIAFENYSILEINQDMYILNQRKAKERILYEALKNNYYNEKQNSSQLLLLPDVITLSKKDMEIAKDNIEMLKKAGFVFEPFGEDTIKLTEVPEICVEMETKELFIEILQEINSVARTERKEIEEKFLQTVAKKVVENERMSNTREETQSIIEKLLSLTDPFDNSKGNPIAIKMSKYDIERKFSRK
mgnify:FL=1